MLALLTGRNNLGPLCVCVCLVTLLCQHQADHHACCRNEPNVHEAKMLDNPDRWHGSDLSVTILGNWQYYRAKIIKYLRQIAVITPYSQFTFTFKSEDASSDIHVVFARRTDKMPDPPKVRSFDFQQLISVQMSAQCHDQKCWAEENQSHAGSRQACSRQ